MTREEKAYKEKEVSARQCFDLVVAYVNNSYQKTDTEKREIYFRCRSDWYKHVDKHNSKRKSLIQMDRDYFRKLVDKNYEKYTKQLFPDVSIFYMLKLKTQTHSYA